MKKVITVILDGVGMRDEVHGNAVKQASMSNFIKLWNKYPHSLLKASESSVGLLKGQFGNSEVGHLTIGAGRMTKQKVTIIEELFQDNRLKNNIVYNEMINYVKNNSKHLHLMMLTSDGGVHSRLKFLLDMLEQLKSDGVTNVLIHVITDGRDTKEKVAYEYIRQVEEKIKELGIGRIVSMCGRYYAMDRDKNYQRTKLYYDLVTRNSGNYSNNIQVALQACYEKNITDEFIPPFAFERGTVIRDGDALLWLNYRTDRAKQILKALKDSSFKEFETLNMNNLRLYTLYKVDEKSEGLEEKNMLEDLVVTNPLGEYISKLGLTQARIAETEKYAHVTYFFDGGRELDLEGCDRFLVPSPKVATYDLKPEMSAVDITKQAIKCMEKDYDFILINYANGDMVGHTGNLKATIKALEAVDICLGKLYEKAEENFYDMVILADHGNADIMLDENDEPVTTHTLSQVPFIITDTKLELANGDLTMVAPTILKYMDIALPKEMKETEDLFTEED